MQTDIKFLSVELKSTIIKSRWYNYLKNRLDLLAYALMGLGLGIIVTLIVYGVNKLW